MELWDVCLSVVFIVKLCGSRLYFDIKRNLKNNCYKSTKYLNHTIKHAIQYYKQADQMCMEVVGKYSTIYLDTLHCD